MKIHPWHPPLVWIVESETRPEVRHLVEIKVGGGECTCEDHTIRGNEFCKHVVSVREHVLDLTILNEQRTNEEKARQQRHHL